MNPSLQYEVRLFNPETNTTERSEWVSNSAKAFVLGADWVNLKPRCYPEVYHLMARIGRTSHWRYVADQWHPSQTRRST